MLKSLPLNTNIITRRHAMYIVSRYFRFLPRLKEGMIDDMLKLKLLEKVNRDKMKIINIDESKEIDSGVFIKIIESGRKGYVFIFGFIVSFIMGMFQK